MPLDHVFQFGGIFGSHRVQLDHFLVAMNGELAADIVYIGDPAAHAGCEIAPGITEDDDPATGHVFTTVISYAFDYRFDAGVANGEAFAGLTADKGFARSGAIEGDITDDAVLFRYEAGVLGGDRR